MAHDTFISYSNRDKPTADAVCAALERHGIRCWIAPRDVLPGMEWGESIANAIQASKVMVMVFSSEANQSRHLRKEVERAISKNVVVIPFRIEDVVPSSSLEYFIGNVHWLDALTTPLEMHLNDLASKIRVLLSALTPSPPLEACDVDRGAGDSMKPLDLEEVSRFCTQCGAPNLTAAKFCTGCGASLVATLKSCGRCGAKFTGTLRFCTSCGAAL